METKKLKYPEWCPYCMYKNADSDTCTSCYSPHHTEEPDEYYPAEITTQSSPNSYYDAGGISTIEVIRAKLTPEQYKGYCLGNVIKYALRMEHKGSPESDSKKLWDYAGWLSNHYQSEK